MTPIQYKMKEFYSSYNYLLMLRRILEDEAEKRIIRKIRKFSTKEAMVFLKKLREVSYERMQSLQSLRLDQVDDCNQIIQLIYEEFRLLGIRIP